MNFELCLTIGIIRLKLPRKDLRAILALQPSNEDALTELAIVTRTTPPSPHEGGSSQSSAPVHHAAISSPASSSHTRPQSPASSKVRAEQKTKLNNRPIPFEICDTDRVKLKIQCLPLTVNIDPAVGQETFSYPSWDRYQLKKL